MIVWSREHLLALQQRIQSVTALPWQVAIGRKLTVSEYILYGVFIRCVLGYDKSLHVPTTKPVVRQPWGHDLASAAGLRSFICDLEPGNAAVMVHSKFEVSVQQLRPLFRDAWRAADG
jgi:hypothetical protein